MEPTSGDVKPAPRKLRFKPKPQARRVPKPVAPKIEATDDAESAEAKELMRRFQENLTKPKFERKVESAQVAFGGYGNNYNRNFPSYEDKSTLTDDEDYLEPWNYYTYYPTTLPLRRPYSGNPAILDEEEFGEVAVYDEKTVNAAKELGFMEENSEPKMLFLQLPRVLPMTKRPTAAENEPSASNSRPPSGANPMERPCILNELKPGLMGKLLVYKSGAVKLKLGDTEYDVSPGSDCGFAQDVAAVNVEKKQCCVVGEVSRHAIVTPNIDSILDSLPDIG